MKYFLSVLRNNRKTQLNHIKGQRLQFDLPDFLYFLQHLDFLFTSI